MQSDAVLRLGKALEQSILDHAPRALTDLLGRLNQTAVAGVGFIMLYSPGGEFALMGSCRERQSEP